jgi:hypothetical protein
VIYRWRLYERIDHRLAYEKVLAWLGPTKKDAAFSSGLRFPIKQGQQIPSNQPDSDDEDGDDDYSGRPMSKEDRKKLRRQGLDDRRAS